jgi:hypothetical protein
MYFLRDPTREVRDHRQHTRMTPIRHQARDLC